MGKVKAILVLCLIVVIGVFGFLLWKNSSETLLQVTFTEEGTAEGTVTKTSEEKRVLKKTASVLKSKGEELPDTEDFQKILAFSVSEKDRGVSSYELYLKEGNERIYSLKEGNTYYEVKSKSVEKLILADDFPLYDNFSEPVLLLSLGDQQELKPRPVSYQWTYEKLGLEEKAIEKEDRGKSSETFLVEDDLGLTLKNFVGSEPLDQLSVTVEQDGKPVFTVAGDIFTDYKPLKNGVYTVTVKGTVPKEEGKKYSGEAVYRFDLDYRRPVSFSLSSDKLFPGELLTVYATYFEEGDLLRAQTPFGSETQFFHLKDGVKVCLIPVSYSEEPKDYTLTFLTERKAEDEKDEASTFTVEKVLTVEPKEFAVQYLKVNDETVENNRNEKAYAELEEKVEPLHSTYDETLHAEGKFELPVRLKINTEFGMQRYVNDELTSYRHSGIDLGAKGGTPVKASNAGTVVFADELIMNGNTVIIEHGYGIKTHYCHLREIDVKAGDEVKTGDIVGKVGTTGFSTGNHLHFTLSVNGVNVNPMTAFEIPLVDTGFGDQHE